MTIATGEPATAADVLAALNNAESTAAAARTAATSAGQLATSADSHAATAAVTATSVVADATAVNAAIPGLQQQITNVKASIDANTTTVNAHTSQIGALTNMVTALEGGAPPAVPNSPTSPTSTSVTATSVTLSATAPASGPAPTSYKWEYKRSADPTFATSSVTTLTGTQSGLTASTSYDFRVSAVNVAGPSAPSPVYTVSTAVSGSLVESAHGTTLTTTNGQIVDAALNVWTLITATGGRGDFQISINGVRQDITGAVTLMKYYNPVGAAAAGTTKHSTAHLNTAGSWYISTGVSNNIATFTQITGDPDATVAMPNAPTAATSTAVTSTSVSLSCTAPVGGGAPASYKWEYKRAADTLYIISSVTTRTGTQSGLTASTSYNFRVSAVNSAGTSLPSAVYTVSTSATAPPPQPSGGPGTGPAFRLPAGNRTIVGGQRCSVNMNITDNVTGWPGKLLHGIKPYFYSGIWRNAEAGNGFFSGGTTVGWLEQGVYLYDDDIARIYVVNGMPPIWDANYPVNGSRLGARFWTYGSAASRGVDLQLFTEPNLDNAPQYDVIVDYVGPSRGDSFRCTPNITGRGRCVQTSWGSYFDLTQDPGGPSGFGLGWVAFLNYSMTMDQIGEVGF